MTLNGSNLNKIEMYTFRHFRAHTLKKAPVNAEVNSDY